MSDEQSSDEKLVLRAEALARELPFREPDWEAFAERVTARITDASSARPPLDEGLLAAPLPAADESPDTVAQPSASPSEPEESALDRLVPPRANTSRTGVEPNGSAREPVSLADLARAAVARRGGREATDIVKESLAVASQTRAQGERTPARAAVAAADAATPAPRRASRAPAVTDSRGPWIGVAIATVGLAAGFGLYFAGQRQPQEVAKVPIVAALAAAEPPAAPRAEQPTAPRVEAPRGPVGESLDSLPIAEAKRSEPAPSEERPTEIAQKVATGSRGAPPVAPGVKPEKVVLDEDPAEKRKGSAAPLDKPREAASGELKPAELGKNDGLSDRPSAGAAQAAVGAVLGAARACIAGHAAPSSATLIFLSSGQVDRVSIAGPAAQMPAAGCVESALKKARVQPFAAESFSLAVTIRPP